MIGAVGIARNLAEQTDFGYMLSLGTIHLEGNYCASKTLSLLNSLGWHWLHLVSTNHSSTLVGAPFLGLQAVFSKMEHSHSIANHAIWYNFTLKRLKFYINFHSFIFLPVSCMHAQIMFWYCLFSIHRNGACRGLSLSAWKDVNYKLAYKQ